MPNLQKFASRRNSSRSGGTKARPYKRRSGRRTAAPRLRRPVVSRRRDDGSGVALVAGSITTRKSTPVVSSSAPVHCGSLTEQYPKLTERGSKIVGSKKLVGEVVGNVIEKLFDEPGKSERAVNGGVKEIFSRSIEENSGKTGPVVNSRLLR